MQAASWTWGVILLAYLLGSVPFALLLGLYLGIDIRKTGSGNIGATNLGRAAGRKWGVLAFLLDFLKGLLPVAAAAVLATRNPEALELSPRYFAIAAGIAAIAGHIFPVYLAFRGGKGVATTFGVMAGLSWPSTLAAGAVWGLLYLLTRTVSIASMTAALALPIAVAVVEHGTLRDDGAGVLALAILLAAVIVWRHRTNLARLLAGEEHRFPKDASLPHGGARGGDDTRRAGEG